MFGRQAAGNNMAKNGILYIQAGIAEAMKGGINMTVNITTMTTIMTITIRSVLLFAFNPWENALWGRK